MLSVRWPLFVARPAAIVVLAACGNSTSASSETGDASAANASGSSGSAGGSSGSAGGSSGSATGSRDEAGAGTSGSDGGTGAPDSAAGPIDGAAGLVGDVTSQTPPQIAAFDYGGCALTRIGATQCWGSLPPDTDTIAPPPGIAIAIGAQNVTACILTVGGAIECQAIPESAPATVPPAGTWSSMAVGVNSVCGVAASGSVQCAEDLDGEATNVPAGVKFTQVGSGTNFGCGIRADDQTIVCWGSPGYSYAGCIPSPPEGQLQPPPGKFVSLSSGQAHSCAIGVDGSVACWGAGKAGAPHTTDMCGIRFNYGQAAPPAGTFAQIAAGKITTCGVKTDGTIACWGAGTMSSGCAADPNGCGQALPPAGTFAQVAVGYTHACAMRANRTVVCWGSNTDGRASPPQAFR